ncbi:MAG: bifunctional DNA-formamidopyrimidine glycosylase/DNA-(apurinic or apyrimidinic site) lyase [Gemmataceae bacterium]
MPELPEVETVVRDLRPLLVGRTVVAVERTSGVGLRRAWDPAWAGLVAGRRVEAVRRRGKWIVASLGGGRLVVHLGMTGQFVVHPADAPRSAHTHFVFTLDRGELRYRDPRRFGSVQWLADDAAVADFFAGQGIGPEPFGVAPGWWREQLAATSRNLKATLLDQTVVAGVGNIYADEALFRARLHPSRRASGLTRPEADRLRRAVEEVLTRAIEARGSTIRDYVGGSGLAGGFQDEFAAYGRGGRPCPRCGAVIAVGRFAGRSSHFCPACQPASSEG